MHIVICVPLWTMPDLHACIYIYSQLINLIRRDMSTAQSSGSVFDKSLNNDFNLAGVCKHDCHKETELLKEINRKFL